MTWVAIRGMHFSRCLPPLPAPIKRCVLILAAVTLTGCASNGARIDRIAADAGLSKRIVPGLLHAHVVYEKAVPVTARVNRLYVFLDGDGSPWGSSGMQPAIDPTTRNPLALRLLLATNAPGVYVARPCYQELRDEQCSSERWTGGRYSEAVVGSLLAAIGNEATKYRAEQLVIVGYSGGGALAVLIAERLNDVAAVITIGANLDIVAWADHHRYLPLTQSLNPAQSERPHPWTEFHFQGVNDSIVPVGTTDAYFERYPQAKRIAVDADHVCCWVKNWPGLLAGLPQSRGE